MSEAGATRSDLVAAYRRAGLVINREQAQCLADLMWEGKLRGTNLPDIEPPRTAALVALGERECVGGSELEMTRDGEFVIGPDGRLVEVEDVAAHTLGVIAEDGRAWQIVRAGITWAVETDR